MKRALTHAIGVYALITILLYALAPALSEQPIWVRTLALVPMMLLGIRYLVNPLTALVFLNGDTGRSMTP